MSKRWNKKKRKGRRGEEQDVFVTGFTEKIFNIRRRVTREQLRKIALSGDPFRIRPIPIFSNEKPRKKKKKRGKR